jgi:8-oxo-dGTP pyrophosphatase MutT (NUDIX family)
MPPCGLDVAALTAGQPFCAGVVLVVDGRLVLTLNRDHLPADLEGSHVRVGGVGGGQEPGETIWDCARREAMEEVGCEVKLVRSPRTYLRQLPDGDLRPARCRDELAPLLFEWADRADPAPYAAGLPAGPRLYGAIFLARAAARELRPVDVEGLLLLATSDWSLIDRGATVRDARDAGVSIVERAPIAPELRLWSYPEESMRAVAELAVRDPDVLVPVA